MMRTPRDADASYRKRIASPSNPAPNSCLPFTEKRFCGAVKDVAVPQSVGHGIRHDAKLETPLLYNEKSFTIGKLSISRRKRESGPREHILE